MSNRVLEIGHDELQRAAELVHSIVPPTPQINWPLLSERCGGEVWVKHENHTPLGAFKVRGGLTYFDWLQSSGMSAQGVISATRGNHGQSVCFASRAFGVPATIVVPEGNSPDRNAAVRALGGELIEHGQDLQDAIEHATVLAEERNLHRIPTFHRSLVLGVASYAVELFQAVEDLDTVYVPIGLGSGICGLISARDILGLKTKIVGVVSTEAPGYALSFDAGKVISHEVTTRIADGMSVRTPDETAFEIIRRGADRIVQVSDDEIEAAMKAHFIDTHNVAEGAGAAALAAHLQEKDKMAGRRVAHIQTGANVDADVFARVLLR